MRLVEDSPLEAQVPSVSCPLLSLCPLKITLTTQDMSWTHADSSLLTITCARTVTMGKTQTVISFFQASRQLHASPTLLPQAAP